MSGEAGIRKAGLEPAGRALAQLGRSSSTPGLSSCFIAPAAQRTFLLGYTVVPVVATCPQPNSYPPVSTGHTLPLPPLAEVTLGGLQLPRSSISECPGAPPTHPPRFLASPQTLVPPLPCPCFRLRKGQPDPDPDPPAVLHLPPVSGPASPRLIPSRLLRALCALTNRAPVSSPDFSPNSRPTYRCSDNTAEFKFHQTRPINLKPGAGLFPSSLRQAALSFHTQNWSINELQQLSRTGIWNPQGTSMSSCCHCPVTALLSPALPPAPHPCPFSSAAPGEALLGQAASL